MALELQIPKLAFILLGTSERYITTILRHGEGIDEIEEHFREARRKAGISNDLSGKDIRATLTVPNDIEIQAFGAQFDTSFAGAQKVGLVTVTRVDLFLERNPNGSFHPLTEKDNPSCREAILDVTSIE